MDKNEQNAQLISYCKVRRKRFPHFQVPNQAVGLTFDVDTRQQTAIEPP